MNRVQLLFTKKMNVGSWIIRTGTVPPTVQAWATAKAWTAQRAADDIAATAQAWESALYAIRSIRLIGKEAVRNATTDSAAQAAYDTVLAQLATIGG